MKPLRLLWRLNSIIYMCQAPDLACSRFPANAQLLSWCPPYPLLGEVSAISILPFSAPALRPCLELKNCGWIMDYSLMASNFQLLKSKEKNIIALGSPAGDAERWLHPTHPTYQDARLNRPRCPSQSLPEPRAEVCWKNKQLVRRALLPKQNIPR